uniref:Ig-like domain-containing protein n=1 Tax=Periophthalmus magnuspinnatus TaxID=409849 RepID=A0A3B4BMM3_9GOBI
MFQSWCIRNNIKSFKLKGQRRFSKKHPCFFLSVPVPARIVNISKDVSVNEGENVNLFCLAVGRPEPTVTWKVHKYGLLSDGEFLDITEIKRQQAADYECVTHNGVAPADQRKVRVTVNYPPIITDVKNMPAHLGKTVILRCEAMAVPAATFEWYRDDHRPVESDNNLRVKHEKTRSLLLFSNVTEKHFGNYTCFASNRLGTSNASMLLFRKAVRLLIPYQTKFPVNLNGGLKGIEWQSCTGLFTTTTSMSTE